MIKATLTFMRRAMKKGNTMKTKISKGSFIVVAAFAVAVIYMIVGTAQIFINEYVRRRNHIPDPIFTDYDQYDEDEASFLFVNPPASFVSFLDDNDSDEYFPSKFSVMDTPYDFVTVGELMRLNGASTAVVFPPDSEEKISANKTLEILTYIRTDRLSYGEAELFIEDAIDSYDSYLSEQEGRPQISITNTRMDFYGQSENNYDSSLFAVVGIIPLIIFITALYTIMTGGTNVIAGEKERGTFAAVILTPSPRGAIVVGNTLGVAILAMIPALILCLLTFLFLPAKSISGLIIALLLIVSFAILISSLTILISIINQSVVSAQTAFLPVFLIILGIAVNCIQKLGTIEKYFLFFPLYGHFFGIGNALCSAYDFYSGYEPCAITCIVISFALSLLVMFIGTRLLYNEKFMTNSGGLSARDLRKKDKPKHDLGIGFLIGQAAFPVVTLSIVQLLAMIPTAIAFMRDSSYSDFILGLKDIKTVSGIVGTMGNIMAMFLSSPVFLISMAIGYLILVGIYCLKIRIIENNRHPLKSMGFIKATDSVAAAGLEDNSNSSETTGSANLGVDTNRTSKVRPLPLYLTGLLLGFGLLTSVCLILIATKNLTFNGLGVNSQNIWIVLSGIPMWFIQGASEEIMFRGYMIPRIKKRFGSVFAIVFSSILFAVFHGANIGFTWLAGINLFIIAVFFALIYIYTDSIWLTCAAHTAWNFCQGSLYGLEVSGSSSGISIISSSYAPDAPAYMYGGAFGPEGGLAVTIVTIVGIIIVSALLIRKKRQIL